MAASASVYRASALLAAFVALLLCGVTALAARGASAQTQDAPKAESGAPAAEGAQPDAGAAGGAAASPEKPAEEGEAAQETPSGEAGPPPPAPEGVEEITVIGETLETSTQAEAAAITSFDQAQLDTLGIANVDTLALNTPSLHVGQVGQQAVITLRGVGIENLTSIGEAGVGFQVDGVHLARPSASNAGFFDLERVDVERGPQGTQGGRNLDGGRIALWSRKPTNEFDASSDVTYGNYNDIENRFVLNAPLWGDTLMSRVSTLLVHRRGYQENDFFGQNNKDAGDAKDFAVRGQLRSLLLDDQIELRAIATHGFQQGRGPDLKPILLPAASTLNNTIRGYRQQFPTQVGIPFANSKYNPTGCRGAPPPYAPNAQNTDGIVVCDPSDARDVYNEFAPDRDNQTTGITGLGTWDLPLFKDTLFSDLRVGFVSSWQQNIENFVYDFDGTNIPEDLLDQHRNAKQKSVEAYLERPDVGRWDFRTGIYWLREDITSRVCFDNNGIATASDVDYQGTITTESIAGYGEGGVRLFDNLRGYAGLRWTRDTKKKDEFFKQPTPVDSPSNPRNDPHACGQYTRSIINRGTGLSNLSEAPSKNSEDFEGYTPIVGFDWQVTDTATLGFSVTRGFKSGGFPIVVVPGLVNLDRAYDSEFTWEYEITSKNELFDGRLRLNTSLFWTEYDPFQVCQFSGPTFFCNSNGSATIRGLELEWIATPIEGLQLNGHFDWLDARVNNLKLLDPTERTCFNLGGCPDGPTPGFPVPQDVSGNNLSKAPPWAGSFGVQYEIDLGRWGFITPRFQTQFQGKTYYRVFNTSFDSQNPFIKYDAKIMWRSEDSRFTAEVFGVNLSDEDVLNSVFIGSQFSGGQAFGQYQAPRTYGVKIGIQYVSDWLAELF